jgi:tetratricopeptide (TPR) repeat protein
MRRPRSCIAGLCTLALLCLCLAGTAHAADWPVPRGPSREPDPYRFDPAAWKKVSRDFLDDAPACTLYSGTTYLIAEDGTTETVVHDVTRFNGRKGIDKLGEYRNITYDPTYEKPTLNDALIHKADGRTVPIEPRHLQLRDLSTDYQVYDHQKQLIITFPSLEVGDTIEVKWTVRGKNPEYQGHFFTRYTFGDDQFPVVADELRVGVPRNLPLKYAAVGGKLEPAVREEDGRRLYVWRATNRRELPQDESAPSKEDLRLQVACSTFRSWEDVGKWKQRLRADCWECSAELRQLTHELTRDLKTPLAKARALTYWVRRNIRYVSLGEKHDYTPLTPATVLLNRYGDCKDQSQMLAVMLREAGVPVALATLGVLDDGQVLEGVPSPWGTHAILLVTLDGKDHWIDTTASLAGWDFLPRDDRDRLCYVVDEKGALRLVRTPPMTAADNRVEQTTRVSVGADGSSRCERSALFTGSAALSQRDSWVEVPPGERRRLLTGELQDANSKTRLVRLTLDEKRLRDFDQPVAATIVFDILGHFSGDPDREGAVAESKLWGKLLAFNLDYDRTVPLDLGAPFELRHRYLITLPPAYHFDSLPRDRDVRSKWGFFTLTVKAIGDGSRQVELDMHARMDSMKIDPADFEEFRRFHEEVGKDYRAWLTLKPADDLDDAPALEAVLAFAPDDSASAVALARLYQQHNLTKEAQRALRRARYYRPNDAGLWEMTVKLAASLEEEEVAYRELVRRFPDEPKYAVALGTTLVDRGQYGKARDVLEPLTRKGTVTAARALAWYQLARASLHENKPDRALEQLDAAVKADGDTLNTVAVLMFRGRVQERLGKAEEAVAAYEQALKVEPDAEEPLLALIRLSWERKNTDDALGYLRRYTVAVGDDLDGLATAAEWNLRLGRDEDAFDLASKAREIGFHERAQRVLGLVALHRGKYEEAALHLGKADLDAEVLDGQLRASLALGRLAEAITQAAQLERIKEPPPDLRRLCGAVGDLAARRKTMRKEARFPAGKEDAGNKALDQYLCADYAYRESAPVERVELLLPGAFADGVEIGPAYGLRGLLALDRGRLGKALADAERALALAPADARGYYVRGRVRLERASKAALADLEKAADLSKRRDATILHWYAAALSQAGRQREALTMQREAVQQKPDDPEIAEQLRELEKAQGGER